MFYYNSSNSYKLLNAVLNNNQSTFNVVLENLLTSSLIFFKV